MINREKLLEKASELGWKGVDASLEISLFEYGLIWIYRPKLDDYLFVVGIGYNDTEQEFDSFAMDWEDIDAFKDYNMLIEREEFAEYMSYYNEDDIHDVPYLISDLISCYGTNEIIQYGLSFNEEEILAYITQKKWMR